jgi:hypothetical protein
MTSVIRSHDYDETVRKLCEDPIIICMAMEVPDDTEMYGSGFLMSALREYQARGGKIQTHIGGPAEAIRLLKDRAAQAKKE